MFEDDGALLTTTRSGAEIAAQQYQETSNDFGLIVSIPKTKHMMTRRLVEESDKEPIVLEGEEVNAVKGFPYLASLIAGYGGLAVDVGRRAYRDRKLLVH